MYLCARYCARYCAIDFYAAIWRVRKLCLVLKVDNKLSSKLVRLTGLLTPTVVVLMH